MRLILSAILILVFTIPSNSQNKILNTFTLIEKIDLKREFFFIDSIPEKFKDGMYLISNINNLTEKINFINLPNYSQKDTSFIIYYCEYFQSQSNIIIGELWNTDFSCKYKISKSHETNLIQSSSSTKFDKFKKLIANWDNEIKDRSYVMSNYIGLGGIICSRIKVQNYEIIEDEHIAFTYFDPEDTLIFLQERKVDGYKIRYKYRDNEKIYVRPSLSEEK